jgi:xanthine dehydrogenase YagT iron-sulfur-binding subunit
MAELSRRQFLARAGAAGVGLASPIADAAQAASSTAADDPASPAPSAGTVRITLQINGKPHAMDIDPRATLLDTLRETLHLTGTKKGCDHGQCGACTVHVDGRRANSCLLFASMLQQKRITTVEGLGDAGHLHPVQAAFVEHDALQCGYCTPGQVMSAVAMLAEPWGPTDAELREAMSGNICRCGAYANILAAIQSVRGS